MFVVSKWVGFDGTDFVMSKILITNCMKIKDIKRTEELFFLEVIQVIIIPHKNKNISNSTSECLIQCITGS